MVEHIIIEPFGISWWKGFLGSFTSIFLILYLLKRQSKFIQQRFQKFLALAFLAAYIITNIINLKNGVWNIQDHLPFHLCRISFIICILTILTYIFYLIVEGWSLLAQIHWVTLYIPEFFILFSPILKSLFSFNFQI